MSLKDPYGPNILPQPQPGILKKFSLSSYALFTIVYLPEKYSLSTLKQDLSKIFKFNGVNTEFKKGVSVILGFGVGTPLYEEIVKKSPPKYANKFKELISYDKKHKFPSTGGDIIFHLKSESKLQINSVHEYIETLFKKDFEKVRVFHQLARGDGDGRNNFGFYDGGDIDSLTSNPYEDVLWYDSYYRNSEETYDLKNLPEQVKDLIKKGTVTLEQVLESLEKKKKAFEKRYFF